MTLVVEDVLASAYERRNVLLIGSLVFFAVRYIFGRRGLASLLRAVHAVLTSAVQLAWAGATLGARPLTRLRGRLPLQSPWRFDEVFAAELRAIARRRDVHGVQDPLVDLDGMCDLAEAAARTARAAQLEATAAREEEARTAAHAAELAQRSPKAECGKPSPAVRRRAAARSRSMASLGDNEALTASGERQSGASSLDGGADASAALMAPVVSKKGSESRAPRTPRHHRASSTPVKGPASASMSLAGNGKQRVPRPSIRPSVDLGLVGLGLSGGGVRAATFAFGAVQALAKHGMLKHVDYLSTVSGGGFFGSCLCSLLDDEQFSPEWDQFPLKHQPGVPEGPATRLLRRSANVMGNGVLDVLTIPILIIRGFLLNLVTIFPFVWMLALARHYAMPSVGMCNAGDDAVWADCFWLTPVIGINFLIHMLSFPILSRPFLSSYVLFVFSTVFFTQLENDFGSLHEMIWSSPLVMASIVLHVVLSYPYLSRREGQQVWYTKSFAGLALACIGCACMESLSIVEQVYTARFGIERTYYLLAAVALLLVADSSAISLIADQDVLSGFRRWLLETFLTVTGPALLVLFYLEVHVLVASSASFFGYETVCAVVLCLLSWFCLDVNETSMHRLYRDRISKGYMFTMAKPRPVSADKGSILTSPFIRPAAAELDELAAGLGTSLTGGGPHATESFKVRSAGDGNGRGGPSTVFRPTGGSKLSATNATNRAPYHIINATVNLSRDDVTQSLGRGYDSFSFSRLFVGSPATGFRRTTTMEKHDRNLDLATAIAVSGAAMSPHMGWKGMDARLVMSLGILNVRLAYWLPNPSGLLLSSTWFGRLFYGYAWLSLLKEFGWLPRGSRDFRVNLSDGGHFDNLGIYELNRRRCRFIIAIDGEHDPDFAFEGLSNVIRMVRLDFGITVTIDLAGLRKNEQGHCKRHWAIGKIFYRKGPRAAADDGEGTSARRPAASSEWAADEEDGAEVGYLLYIKASTTGKEDQVIQHYSAVSRRRAGARAAPTTADGACSGAHHGDDAGAEGTFPHESTGDQDFTGVGRFESYRSLGFLAAGKDIFGSSAEHQYDERRDLGELVERLLDEVEDDATASA